MTETPQRRNLPKSRKIRADRHLRRFAKQSYRHRQSASGLGYDPIKIMKRFLSLAFVLLFLISSCRFRSKASLENPPTTVAYKTVEGIDPDLLSLDIYLPANPQNAPVVMWVHGGGYAIGDKAYQIADKVALFNGQGWVLVSVNYRLSTPEKGAAQFPDHFLDVASAVAWVWEDIPAYGGDPNRVALLGHSAGADIVSNVAVNPIYLKEYGLELSAITCAAPLDTAGFDKAKAGDTEQEQWQNALGNNPNYIAETSATLLIQPNSGIPPMLGVTRGNESRQQIQTEFIAALQTAGIEATLVEDRKSVV